MCKAVPQSCYWRLKNRCFCELRPFGVVENLFKKCGWRSPVGYRIHRIDAQVFIRIRSDYSFMWQSAGCNSLWFAKPAVVAKTIHQSAVRRMGTLFEMLDRFVVTAYVIKALR